MLVLGIDPGTATTGFGVIKKLKTGFEVIDWGLIETEKNGVTGKRLDIIYSEILELLRKFSPDVLAIEKIFFATNAKTAISIGQAQGVILLAAAKSKVEVSEYAPGTIKKVVAGDGRADKKAMQRALRVHLGARIRSKKGKKTHFDNEADALAIALCHVFTGGR
ncbi:crossover junction endodeoxyribonuclease RuvC [Candidatus Woesebacteria bacterium RIFCSPHIGHO2_12_FULL_42_9]|uniref:Crossover junction endodeoxyribonuclease RuvC n=2 Tax=Candidatus Woeseibacteriota TaxID=1752722 RepID=A0A1F8AYN6_9BACT|nr:MAG: crossover junction endodeoxyribonuclease RuvC [Candidatus Woesebacteria bacterium GWA1_42_12]OGM56345.1 MAG: crossover junction endodeoxyribonuclease RuvC [Candidatus Woesebacteria bacterium RIFCSPHIGHO2_12_FULL_42_9]